MAELNLIIGKFTLSQGWYFFFIGLIVGFGGKYLIELIRAHLRKKRLPPLFEIREKGAIIFSEAIERIVDNKNPVSAAYILRAKISPLLKAIREPERKKINHSLVAAIKASAKRDFTNVIKEITSAMIAFEDSF